MALPTFWTNRPAKKRESEWKCFEELRADYSAEDIADCLDVLVRHGIGKDGGERCHSPMAFLGKAMGEVLVEVGKYRVRAKERAVREEREAKELREKLAIEEREAEELAAKEKAFLMAFPTEDQKNEALARFCRGTPFAVNTHAGRIIALGKWWESLGAHERENYVLLAGA